MFQKFKKFFAARGIKLFCFGFLLTILLFAIPKPADAFWSLSSIIVGFFLWPIYIMQFIATLFFSLAGYLTGLVLNFNYNILGGNAFIAIGWSILRDIANLGFVFFIIVIAIATILRYKEYGTQKALFTLIAAAIAVNFSLTIAGIFIDASHSLTKFFFAPIDATHNPFKIATMISGAFNPQNLFAEPEEPEPLDPDEEVGGFKKFGTAVLLQIAGAFFALIFTLIAAFVLFAYAIMLLLRYLWLSFLLIVSPIIYLMMIVPRQKKYWDEWWNKFISWTFFAPASAAFIYLALISIEKLNEGVGTVSPAEFFKNGAMQAIMQQGVNMIILCGLLIGGLWAAQSMGIGAANGFMGAMKKVSSSAKKWTKERAKTYGQRAVTAPFRGDRAKAAINRMQNWGQNRGRFLRTLSLPVRQLGGGLQAGVASVQKQVAAERERQKGKTFDQRAREFNRYNAAGRTAFLEDAASKGKQASREVGQAEETLTRAQERVRRTNLEVAATAAAGGAEHERAQRALLDAQESLANARNNFNKVNDEFNEFQASLMQIPNNVREALVQANYNLTNVPHMTGARPKRFMATIDDRSARNVVGGAALTRASTAANVLPASVLKTSVNSSASALLNTMTAANRLNAQAQAQLAQTAARSALEEVQSAQRANTDTQAMWVAARAAQTAARAAQSIAETWKPEYAERRKEYKAGE